MALALKGSRMSLIQTLPAARRYDLDWLRVIAFGLLIFYHIGMFYVTWEWHVKSAHASPAIEPIMALLNPWRLPLLFFVSGVALRFAMDKARLREFLPRRFWRLALPIVFGMAVVVAPQAYFELVFKGEATTGFLAFWPDYLDPDQEFSIITPTWNHLWYVVYLLVYTFALAALSGLLKKMEHAAERFFAWCGSGLGAALVFVPVVLFVAYDLLLSDRFPVTHTLVDDWFNHANSFTLVVLGYLAAKSQGFWRSIERAFGVAVAVAVTCGLALLAARLGLIARSGVMGELLGLVRIVYAWAVIVSLLGIGQRTLNRSSAALAYLTEAAFPYYIVHQTIIVCAGALSLTLGLPLTLELPLIVISTLVGCAAGYEVIRRIGVVRPFFGLLPAPRATARTPSLVS
jgi:surface polysaccharide O-acyltransferase-like enzyme